MRLQYAKMRPMSRYKQHQGSNLMTRDYTPSRAELRLGWAPARPKQKAGKQRAPIGHAMLSDIKAKERPTASSLNARLQALQQVRQMEACKRATLLVDV